MSFGSRFWKRITPPSDELAPDGDREPEHEQRVREQRAEDRELRHDELARAEREDHDEELRQVAERRLQHSRHGGAELRADRLGRDPDRPRDAAERGPRENEDRDRRCAGVVEDAGQNRRARRPRP